MVGFTQHVINVSQDVDNQLRAPHDGTYSSGMCIIYSSHDYLIHASPDTSQSATSHEQNESIDTEFLVCASRGDSFHAIRADAALHIWFYSADEE